MAQRNDNNLKASPPPGHERLWPPWSLWLRAKLGSADLPRPRPRLADLDPKSRIAKMQRMRDHDVAVEAYERELKDVPLVGQQIRTIIRNIVAIMAFTSGFFLWTFLQAACDLAAQKSAAR